MDPADWPPPSRPYFMLAVDTSGSLTACTNPVTSYPTSCPAGATPNSCGWEPTRYNDAKCALLQTVLAFAGEVNFGLSTYAADIGTCPAGTCNEACSGTNCDFELWGCGFFTKPGTSGSAASCGPGSNATREGGWIRVGMLQDDWWSGSPPPATNVPALVDWMDYECGNDNELFAGGRTPLNGILRDVYRYFDAGWTDPVDSTFFASPLDAQDRACRDVNVILITDGIENCDTGDPPGAADYWAEDAAADLFAGITKGSTTWPVRTHVINFAGGSPAQTNAIAAAGNGVSASANNEIQLAQELAGIIASAVQPETCNNGDDNCNGCTDEGYRKHCNVGQTCCSWTNATERDTCLADYEATITTGNPDGDLEELPCTTVAESQDPNTWLCYDPGDICDDIDNNCQDGVDENQLKCGSPPHCPSPEVCDGIDNDCNGQIDDGAGCTPCVPSTEVCDGCDNDCDGTVDNPPMGGFADQACGLPSPPAPNFCEGTASCQAPQAAPFQGGCVGGAGYGTCSNTPGSEICNNVDDDCNGLIDDGLTLGMCIPTSHAAGLVYKDTNPFSVCERGTLVCNGGPGTAPYAPLDCEGGVGPGIEVCDGLDNDCDGFVDAADPEGVFGENQPCGPSTPPCSPGNTQCVNGAIICDCDPLAGCVGPTPEICDGINNDCDLDGIDEPPLADAPLAGMTGCWDNPGSMCSHGTLSWDPPAGATCFDTGGLVAPCSAGALACENSAWVCNNAIPPTAEVCDGLNNDCDVDGMMMPLIDEAPLPQVGDTCGNSNPPCMPGTLDCQAGSLVCVGGTGPNPPELCNNIDDDCNGIIDDGVPNGGACDMPYDTNDYPGDRSNPPCQPGQLQCDGAGNMTCVGGLAPQPEVCDGLDNDCDGLVDEALGTVPPPGTPAPDYVDGTQNQFPPPDAVIGEACGINEGQCAGGNYVCENGLFQCFGGQGPVIETCDCEDNDCDGLEDEAPMSGEPPLCSPGKDCIKSTDFCQCASPCSSGEYPCPPGQVCEEVTVQGSGGVSGFYCVIDYAAVCGDCETKTVEDGNGDTVCAPKGTDPPGCEETPECVCRNQSGCREPCFDVTCGAGTVCSNFGPTPGTCVDDICYQTGCPGCNKGCHEGVCADNPCTPDACQPDEMCTPNADWTAPVCTKSCADVTCPGGQNCVAGECVPWCDPLCTGGQVCDPSTQMCVDSQCTDTSCPNGAYCDPLTGMCGDHPCAGVTCPDGQECTDGECGHDGSGGNMGTGGAGGGGGGGAATSSSGQGGDSNNNGVFGLPTGGGGCLCEVGAPAHTRWQWLGLVALGLALGRRRRPPRGREREGEEVSA